MASSFAGNGKVTLPLIPPPWSSTPAPASASAPAPAPPTSRPPQSSPPRLAQPLGAPIPALELLPVELLLPIVHALVPAAPLTTRFALRPAGTWEFRDADHQYADWLRAHSDLLALACTSRRMAAFAKPLLFHTIVVRDARGLVKLYRRMRQRPEIRPLIRELACLVNVAGERTVAELHVEWQRQTGAKWYPVPAYRNISEGLRGAGGAGFRDIGEGLDLIGLALLEGIVLNSSNLCDLLLAFPDHQLPGTDATETAPDVMAPEFGAAVGLYVANSHRYPVSLMEVRGASYLTYLLYSSRLTSLRIYCHREQYQRKQTFSRYLADCAVSSLATFTTLRTLELCCSSFGNFASDPVTLPPLPHIEHLRLYGSYLHEPRLAAIVLACTKLQTLLVHFENSTTDDDRRLLPGPGTTLNDALRTVASTLHTLELVALAEGHYITRGRERPRKPENHRLTCIPDLHRLTDLTLDYRGVFGTLGILEEDDGERLCQLLPAGVRHFTLVCEWGTEKDWKQSYLANLDMMLYGVGCLCAMDSLHLESISLAIHSWPAKSRFHKRFKREMEGARLRCAAAGIKFRTFDLLPSYRDEDEFEPEEEDDEDEDEDVPGVGETMGEVPVDDAEGSDEELELEEEDEASEYYMSGDSEPDPEREALRPASFDEFLERLGDDHGHSLDDLFFAYHEDRWDEYLF